MLDAIGQIIPLAVVVALSPAPILIAAIVLPGPGGVRRGLAVLAGRVTGVLLVVGVFLLFAEALAGLGLPPLVGAIVRVLLGAGLLGAGVRKLAARSAAETTAPRWMASLEGMGAGRAFGLAVVVSAANPKELAMGAAAGMVIGSTVPEVLPALGVLAIYTIIAVTGVSAPVLGVLLAGERAALLLDDIRGWLDRNSAALMAIVLVVFGAILLGEGISVLGR